MTDLHTHILPGMDDGAKSPEDALCLLNMELQNGVEQVALTSHFSCDQETPEEFLQRREAAFSRLLAVAPAQLRLKRGCEVYYSPAMLQIEPERLCLEGTGFLLLELPLLFRPAYLDVLLQQLQLRGIVPLIAHVERYDYVRRNPRLLAEWISMGALIQINAQSVLSGDRFVRKLLKWGLVQVVASDAHSCAHRPPNLGKAMEHIGRICGTESARRLRDNARAVFNGEIPEIQRIHIPRKVLGFWI